MSSFLKKLSWLAGAVLVLGAQSSFGFALFGPVPAGGTPDAGFQTAAIGYGISGVNGDVVIGGNTDFTPGDPKLFGDEYRRNTPVVYYSFDEAFLQFFGSNGVAAVDQAMNIYNSLTNVSAYSPDLSEFPFDSRRINFTAQALSLTDLKSFTMGIMAEELGFSQPVRWVWSLAARVHITFAAPFNFACPANMEYFVIQRNYELDTASTSGEAHFSSYVNNVLYSYVIAEFCQAVAGGSGDIADAVEFPVDPFAEPYSAVADFRSFWYSGLNNGAFYTSLTHDDVAALRYLLRTNNMNLESSGPRTVQFVTNTQPAIIVSQDLGLLLAEARTNDAATLLALFPGLVISSSSNYFGLGVATNVTAYISNAPPFAPAGTLSLYFATNYTTNVVQFFDHTFANVITNTFSTKGFLTFQTISVSGSPYWPAGTLPTIVTNTKTVLTNMAVGDFFILPTNLCGATILSNLLTTVIPTTNLTSVNTDTNATGGATNGVVFAGGATVTYFTNHTLLYLPITCPEDTIATRQGIERIRFVRRDYDSLVGQFFYPVTNDYTLMAFTNSSLVPQRIRRTRPTPDFLFSVVNLNLPTAFGYTSTNPADGSSETLTFTLGQVQNGLGYLEYFRTVNFNDTLHSGNRNGPGTIESGLNGGLSLLPTIIAFNRMSPLYDNSNFLVNTTNAFINDQTTQFPIQSWASYDGTTNPPIIYPDTASLEAIENAYLGPFVTTASIPTATIGQFYSAQLSAVGGQSPYTWSLVVGSGLPTGLSLSSDGELSGTPTDLQGIYDFTVRVTDSGGGHKDVVMTITLNP